MEILFFPFFKTLNKRKNLKKNKFRKNNKNNNEHK